MSLPPLRFSRAASEAANHLWGANCGPHALAAACGFTLERARELLPAFAGKGFTNPTMMGGALFLAGVRPEVKKGLYTSDLVPGINRIQWEGRWLKPGVPFAAAYAHTHWVAFAGGYVYCTACGYGWAPEQLWRDHVAGICREEGYDGWHVTHQYAFTAPAGEGA